MQVNKILKLISAINDTGRVARDMYDLDKKYYHSQSKDEYIPIAEMDIQYLIRAFIKLINGNNDARYENLKELCQENDKQEKETKELNKQLLYQEKIIDGLRSQVKTLNDIIEEKDDTIDFNRKKFHYWHKAYNEVTDVKGCRYVFSEIPNDTEGQEFVDTCKKYLNRESYTIRVKGQHIKDELRGQGRTAYGQNLSESSCMRIYIDTKKGDE